jgi:hypothetical protein
MTRPTARPRSPRLALDRLGNSALLRPASPRVACSFTFTPAVVLLGEVPRPAQPFQARAPGHGEAFAVTMALNSNKAKRRRW